MEGKELRTVLSKTRRRLYGPRMEEQWKHDSGDRFCEKEDYVY